MRDATVFLVTLLSIITSGCIIIAPNHTGKPDSEIQESLDLDTSTAKKTIVIKHSSADSISDKGITPQKTEHQTIIINGEGREFKDLDSLPPEVSDILGKYGIKIDFKSSASNSGSEDKHPVQKKIHQTIIVNEKEVKPAEFDSLPSEIKNSLPPEIREIIRKNSAELDD